MTLRSIIDAWNRFWFTPRSPVPLAVFRILFGILCLETAFHFALDFHFYYGTTSFFDAESIANLNWKLEPAFDLLTLLPQDDRWRIGFFCVYVLSLVFFTLGLFTNYSAFAAYLCVLSLQTHCPFNWNAGDRYQLYMLLLFCLSNAGSVLSLDSLIKHRKDDWRVTGFDPAKEVCWVQRAMQIQLTMVYMHTYFSKLSGPRWVDGSILYYVTRYYDFQRVPLPFLIDQKFMIPVMTYGTLLVELALWTLIWIKEFRYWILFLGVCMHVGIEVMMNIPVFENEFMATYILFIEPEDLSKGWTRVKALVHNYITPPAQVAFDGSCMFCVRTVGLLHRLDVFALLQFHDFRNEDELAPLGSVDLNRAEREILLKLGDKWIGGFYAFRAMAWRLPLLWVFAPFLYFPGASVLGKGAYSWISRQRHGFIGAACTGALCSSGET